MGFLFIIKKHFGGSNTNTKPIQNIKHHLEKTELPNNTRPLCYDGQGEYVYLPKCNFDVEICVDAIRLLDKYDTFCLFSSDADFAYLCQFLKKRGKKIIIIRGGFIQRELKSSSDLDINAQQIKKYITDIMQKSSPKG